MAISADNAGNQIAYGLAVSNSRLVIDKAAIGSTVAGQMHSLWRATGQPGQGAIPTAAAVCDHTLTGCLGFAQQTAPVTSYLASLEATNANNVTSIEVHDRLMHMGGLSGTVTTAQTANVDLHANLGTSNLAERIGDANYSDVQWWLEWYADTGATVATATVAVTYNDGSTGNLTGVSLAATRRASFLQPLNGLIPAAAAGKFIRDVDSVTLSVSTGAAGNFGVTASRLRGSLVMPLANMKFSAGWDALPISKIPNSSCPYILMQVGGTTTGALRGGGKIIHV
jgi:hypothetical protein